MAPRPVVNVTAAARGGGQPSTATVSRARTRLPPPPRVLTTAHVTRAGRVALGSVSLLTLARWGEAVRHPLLCQLADPDADWRAVALMGSHRAQRAADVSISRSARHRRKHCPAPRKERRRTAVEESGAQHPPHQRPATKTPAAGLLHRASRCQRRGDRRQ